MKELDIRTTARREMVNITGQVIQAVASLGAQDGLCQVFVPHTTAALVLNENADPDVARDLLAAYEALVPKIRFAHAEGNSDAHLLCTLLGSSLTLRVAGQRLRLGTWQGIFLVELDGPRSRRVWVSMV